MRAFQENLLVLIASALIIFAPLIRSGKTSLALMTMELMGIALLLIIFWSNLAKDRLEKPVWWFLVASLACALAYLIPLPDSVWEQLPGRAFYAEHLSWLNPDLTTWNYQAASLIPLRTLAGLLALLAPLGIFLTVVCLPERKITWLIYLLLIVAFSQAALSIGQYFIQDQALFFNIWSYGIPLGTYINQNHFVAFMEMVEPLAIGLMIINIIRQDVGMILKISLSIIFSIISLALTFTPLLTTSRTGAALLILSVILSFWVMTTPEIRKKVARPIFALRFLLLILAIAIQLKIFQHIITATVSDRLKPEAIFDSLRWPLYRTTIEATHVFWPLGTGPSTMPQVYQKFQPIHINGFVNHAHNDYLELFLDLGLFGILVIFLLVFIYIRRWYQLWKCPSSEFKLLRTGAGVGLLLALLYSMTDFGLHTPANAVFFAFLFGIFLHKQQLGENKLPSDNEQKQ